VFLIGFVEVHFSHGTGPQNGRSEYTSRRRILRVDNAIDSYRPEFTRTAIAAIAAQDAIVV
jgi:hypothetical protein